jgi:hypothetical protein
MRGSEEDLLVAEDYGEGFISRQVEWGGMIVEISAFPAGVDATPIFKGLPDDMCQSPHWGYGLLWAAYSLKCLEGVSYDVHEEASGTRSVRNSAVDLGSYPLRGV